MRQVLIVSGVLGGGTTLVFAVAALVATMFPSGTLVPTSPWGGDARFERAMPAVGPRVDVDPSIDFNVRPGAVEGVN